MSIFVDKNETFEVSIKFLYIINDKNILTGIKILPEDASGENVNKLICHAVGRDFDTMSRILEDATVINHITGKPMLKASTLSKRIFVHFFKSWDVEDEDGIEVPIDLETINNLHHTIVTALSRRWLRATSGKTS